MKNLLKITTLIFVLLLTGIFTQVFGNDRFKPVNGRFRANVVPPGVGYCPDIPDAFARWGGAAFRETINL